jgi:hypothetical protein
VDNKVINILEDYLVLEKLKKEKNYEKLDWEQKDEFRLQNDNDAKFYYEKKLKREDALKADTIFSFWTPYCRLLKLEADWKVYKNARTIKTLEALLKQIKATWENSYTVKINEINDKLESFAKVCYTKGNYMLLPERQMNIQRYRVTEDRIDSTLYECFDKGALSKFFESNDSLITWITEQNLHEVCFENCVSKDNIKWLVKENKPKLISEMNANEIYEYINNAVMIINKRNEN